MVLVAGTERGDKEAGKKRRALSRTQATPVLTRMPMQGPGGFTSGRGATELSLAFWQFPGLLGSRETQTV